MLDLIIRGGTIVDGKGAAPVPIRGLSEVTMELPWTPGLKWVRADVRTKDGKLQLIGNPVYLERRDPKGRRP